MGRHFRIGRWAALSAVALLAACKPAPEKPFQPYPMGKGYVDNNNPNCHLGYKAFHKHALAKAHVGWDVLQATGSSAPSGGKAIWAKVEVFEPPAEGDIYIFTLPGHPAHPAVLLKQTHLSSEGISFSTVGCAWGDRKAFIRFRAISQATSEAFLAETRPSPPWIDDVVYPPGQDPDDDRIRAPKNALVATVADRAYQMHQSGQELTTRYVYTPDDTHLTAATFTWIATPPPLADRYQILDAAHVSVESRAGAEAVVGWCASPDGARTPTFCAKARKLNEWSDDWRKAAGLPR